MYWPELKTYQPKPERSDIMGRFILKYQPENAWTDAQHAISSLHAFGLSDATIAKLLASTAGTVNKIRHGHESGRNLEPRIVRLCETINANYAKP